MNFDQQPLKIELDQEESLEGKKLLLDLVCTFIYVSKIFYDSAITAPNAHPYQAGLLLTFGGGTGLCGGSLIGPTWAMTAAHCTAGSASAVVVLGAHHLHGAEANQQRFNVPSVNYRNHPAYNPNNLNNDIALLLLPSAPTLNTVVAISIIPALGRGDQFAGVMSTASGWGRHQDGSTATSDLLRSVQNPIITNAVCAATYGTSVIFDGVICTSTTGGQGPCNGDSGGPLTIAEAAGRTQVGIAAFVAAAGCGAGFPAGYARVSHFRAWIQTTSGI